MPRALRLLCALCLLAGVVLLHREVLFTGMVYHMDDAADGYYPSHVAIWRAFREGHLPTWERGAWSGFPLLADPYYGAFYPLSATFYLLGMVHGLGVNIALHSLIGAVGMFTLLRRRRLPAGAALLGACSLGLSSFMVERIRHIIFPQLMAWLPWVLCFAEGYLTSPAPGVRRRELALLALSLGLALICGALPLLPFAALVLCAYLLPRALCCPGPRLPAFLGLALGGVIGLLLGMAQLVPTLAHLPHSPRQLGADYAFASSYAWPDIRYLATLVAPDLFGGSERGSWRGAYNHWEMAGWYVGAWAVVLALLGVARRRGRPELVALGLCALLAIGLAFGDATPLHRWFFDHVPIYAALRCPVRALVMFLLAAPILAAEGLTWLLGKLAAGSQRQGRWLGGAVAAALAGGTIFALLGPLHLAQRLGPSALAATFGGALGHLALCLGAGAAVLLLVRGGVLPAGRGGIALAVLTLVDLVLIGRGHIQPRPADFAAGTERFGAVDWLLAQRPTDRFAIDPQGPFRLHNLGLTYGLEGAGGYDSYSIWRYVHFLYVLNHGTPYPHPQLRHDPAAGDIHRVDSPLVDLLNVRWSIGPRPPAPGWIERFRLSPGEALHARYEPFWDPQLRVYENPHPLPRAFVVYAATVIGDKDDREQARALVSLDPRERVLLDQAPVPVPQSRGRTFTPARLVRAERHRLVIEAEAQTAGVLVVSEAFYPGWSATLDGMPAPLLRANYAFRGVALPAGRHVVEMRFRSRPAELGLLLSALGLVGLLALGAAAVLRRSA